MTEVNGSGEGSAASAKSAKSTQRTTQGQHEARDGPRWRWSNTPESAVVAGAAEDFEPPKKSLKTAAIVNIESRWEWKGGAFGRESDMGGCRKSYGQPASESNRAAERLGELELPRFSTLELQDLSQSARTGAFTILRKSQLPCRPLGRSCHSLLGIWTK